MRPDIGMSDPWPPQLRHTLLNTHTGAKGCHVSDPAASETLKIFWQDLAGIVMFSGGLPRSIRGSIVNALKGYVVFLGGLNYIILFAIKWDRTVSRLKPPLFA